MPYSPCVTFTLSLVSSRSKPSSIVFKPSIIFTGLTFVSLTLCNFLVSLNFDWLFLTLAFSEIFGVFTLFSSLLEEFSLIFEFFQLFLISLECFVTFLDSILESVLTDCSSVLSLLFVLGLSTVLVTVLFCENNRPV